MSGKRYWHCEHDRRKRYWHCDHDRRKRYWHCEHDRRKRYCEHVRARRIRNTDRIVCTTQFNTYQNPQLNVRIGLFATPNSTHTRIHYSMYESDCLHHPVQHIPEPTIQRTDRIVCNTQFETQQRQQSSVRKGLFVKIVLNWAICLFAEHASDSSTNYNSFLN